jgi:exodeoxyribonuclease-3
MNCKGEKRFAMHTNNFLRDCLRMKIVSYNVNGIRSALSKGLLNWMVKENADVYCLQELKAQPDQIDTEAFVRAGYPYLYFHPAENKGYSGVGIISKVKPDHVEHGFGHDDYDKEGRIIRADFAGTSVVSVYIPSGSSGDARQAYKMIWLDHFHAYINELKSKFPHLVICGDYNICHHPIDIHDPVGNKKSSGFLPEEREWLSTFVGSGFIDSFRHFNKAPHQYSWWTFRTDARSRNKGWRIDYCMVAEALQPRLKASGILADVIHSDHCPVWVEV